MNIYLNALLTRVSWYYLFPIKEYLLFKNEEIPERNMLEALEMLIFMELI